MSLKLLSAGCLNTRAHTDASQLHSNYVPHTAWHPQRSTHTHAIKPTHTRRDVRGEFLRPYGKDASARPVEGDAVHWRQVSQDPLVHLHVRVHGRGHQLPEAVGAVQSTAVTRLHCMARSYEVMHEVRASSYVEKRAANQWHLINLMEDCKGNKIETESVFIPCVILKKINNAVL